STEPALLAHYERLKGRPRLEGAHEPDKTGTLDELSARDAVVYIHILLGDRPALSLGVGSRVLDLASDRLCLVHEAVLLGTLPRVDRGDHRSALFTAVDEGGANRSEPRERVRRVTS